MKKILKIAALAFCGCILSGCTDNIPFISPRPDFSPGYTAEAQITCGKLKAKADIAYNAEDDWSFTFTEPKALSGMELKLTEEGVEGKLGALGFSADENDTYTMLPEIVANAVEALANVPSENRSVSDGIITIDTKYNEQTVTVTADESGKLISLKCPYYSLSVEFSNQKKIIASDSSGTESSEQEPTVTVTPVEQ